MKKQKMIRSIIVNTLMIFGFIGILYGFSEFMVTLKATQMLLGKAITMKPELLNSHNFHALIQLSIGQSTAMKVIAYIAPGFIILGISFILLFLSRILNHLETYQAMIDTVIKEFTDPSDQEDEVIYDLTDEVKVKGPDTKGM